MDNMNIGQIKVLVNVIAPMTVMNLVKKTCKLFQQHDQN